MAVRQLPLRFTLWICKLWHRHGSFSRCGSADCDVSICPFYIVDLYVITQARVLLFLWIPRLWNKHRSILLSGPVQCDTSISAFHIVHPLPVPYA